MVSRSLVLTQNQPHFCYNISSEQVYVHCIYSLLAIASSYQSNQQYHYGCTSVCTLHIFFLTYFVQGKLITFVKVWVAIGSHSKTWTMCNENVMDVSKIHVIVFMAMRIIINTMMMFNYCYVWCIVICHYNY